MKLYYHKIINIFKLCVILRKILKFGAPGKIRTPDPLIRSQVLYPAELPVLFRPTQDQIYDLCLNAYQQLGKS